LVLLVSKFISFVNLNSNQLIYNDSFSEKKNQEL
jgi:hypothetical protein